MHFCGKFSEAISAQAQAEMEPVSVVLDRAYLEGRYDEMWDPEHDERGIVKEMPSIKANFALVCHYNTPEIHMPVGYEERHVTGDKQQDLILDFLLKNKRNFLTKIPKQDHKTDHSEAVICNDLKDIAFLLQASNRPVEQGRFKFYQVPKNTCRKKLLNLMPQKY